MAGKTNTELIRELASTVTTLVERVDNIRHDIDRMDAAQTKTAEVLSKTTTQHALLEDKFAELKKAREETDRRRWSLSLAVVTCLLTLLANVVLLLLRK